MNKPERLLMLYMALRYDRYVGETIGRRPISLGQRICINQERAALMKNDFEFLEAYQQVPEVNEKINFMIDKLHRSGFYEMYLYEANSIFKDD